MKFTRVKLLFALLVMLGATACLHTDDSVGELLERCDEIDKSFTASNVDSLLREVKLIETDPLTRSSLALKTYCTLLRARACEFRGEYDDAISGFRDVLSVEMPADTSGIHWSSILDNAHWSIMQIANCYQFDGRFEEGVAEFKRISENPAPIVRQSFMPDVYATIAYLESRMAHGQEVTEAVDKVFAYCNVDSLPVSRKSIIYTYAAAACYTMPEKQNDVIKWCEKCLEIYEQEPGVIGIHWLSTMLGSLYHSIGEVGKAIDMYRLGYEVSKNCGDMFGAINSCLMLCDLYLTYNMPRLADVYVTAAFDEIESAGNMQNDKYIGQTYMMKGSVMRKAGKIDSALIYWNKAESLLEPLQYDRGMADLETAIGEMAVEDSVEALPIDQGIRHLRNVVEKSTAADTRARAYFFLAKAYDAEGNSRSCETCIDSMSHLLQLTERPIYIERAYKFALDYYLRKGNTAKIQLYAGKLNDELSLFYDSKAYDSVVGQMLRFQSEKNATQIQAAEAELQKKDLKIQSYVLLSLLLLILLVLVVVWTLMKRRIYNIKTAIATQKINTLIENLQEANSRSEKIEQHISEIRSDETTMQRFAMLTPQTLLDDGEARFRDRFECIYPQFLTELRKIAPGVTRREEILCMLIALGQNTEQIADVMCIAHGSINIMRHRLRRKMNLEKTDSLETGLRTLIGNHDESDSTTE